MKDLEKIKLKGKVIAIVVKHNININEGVNFLTKPNGSLQLAIHKHSLRYETKIHHNKLARPINVTQKYKYIYMVKGSSKLELIIKKRKIFRTVILKSGDSVIILDILHKIIFAPKSQAIEIKQGPYEG